MLSMRWRWQRLVWIVLLGMGAGTPCPAQGQAPTIDKIDPPNWFAHLPMAVGDTLLLVKGTGLREASFSVDAPRVQVLRSLASPNGHWAMVWLDTRAAEAGTLRLTARSGKGEATARYTLQALRPERERAAGFSAADVMYCLMPDRFADGDRATDTVAKSTGTLDRQQPRAYHGGDLQGVINHLDYLQELGVTTVWLTPVVQNNLKGKDYHGYGATDLYAVDPRLGSLADYRRLGDELHQRHMKLVFDDVPNHVGPAHPWVADSPLPDWFHGTAARHAQSNDRFETVTDPHAAPESKTATAVLDGWFVDLLPDMNQGNPVVAQYLTENMIWWIEEGGVDGLRIDTFPYVQRRFWQGYLSTLKSVYPHLTAVGEVSGADPTVNAFFAGGRTLMEVDTHLDTPFDYPLYHTLRPVLLGKRPMTDLEATLREDWLYPHPERLVTFLGNHDVPRFLSEPGASPALLRMGEGLLMTMRGTPQLYAGDEIGMQGGEDPDNRRDFPGGFPGDPANAFTPQGRNPEQRDLHDWVAALGKLRVGSGAILDGRQQTVLADETGFAFVRTSVASGSACLAEPGSSLLVAMNRSGTPRSVTVALAGGVLEGCKVARPALGDTGGTTVQAGADGTLQLALPAFGFVVYRLE